MSELIKNQPIKTVESSKNIQILAVALLGIILLSILGLAPMDVIHNATHDVRHSAGFPCH